MRLMGITLLKLISFWHGTQIHRSYWLFIELPELISVLFYFVKNLIGFINIYAICGIVFIRRVDVWKKELMDARTMVRLISIIKAHFLYILWDSPHSIWLDYSYNRSSNNLKYSTFNQWMTLFFHCIERSILRF